MMYEYKCEYCGKVMQTKWPSHKRRYCSKVCSAKGAWEEYRQGGAESECFDPAMDWKRSRGRWLCPYQETVSCERRLCHKCGWNPEVAEKRRVEGRPLPTSLHSATLPKGEGFESAEEDRGVEVKNGR